MLPASVTGNTGRAPRSGSGHSSPAPAEADELLGGFLLGRVVGQEHHGVHVRNRARVLDAFLVRNGNDTQVLRITFSLRVVGGNDRELRGSWRRSGWRSKPRPHPTPSQGCPAAKFEEIAVHLERPDSLRVVEA